MSFLILIFVLFISVYCDLKDNIIPNRVTLTTIILGLIVNIALNGKAGGLNSVLGIMTGLALLIIPFAIGGIGGGDVKLMMAVGALMGWRFVIEAMVYTAIIGALMALFIMVYQKKYKKSIANIKRYLISTILLKNLVAIEDEAVQTYFPYGVPIAIGTFMAVYFNFGIKLF